MAKFNVPNITSLDALLMLVGDPKQLKAYLQELKDHQDRIAQQLEWLDTKDKADRYLAEAGSAKKQAIELLEQARASSAKRMADAKADGDAREAEIRAATDRLSVAQAAFKSESANFHKWCKQVEDSLDERGQLLTVREEDVSRREAALVPREAELSARLAKLEAALR